MCKSDPNPIGAIIVISDRKCCFGCRIGSRLPDLKQLKTNFFTNLFFTNYTTVVNFVSLTLIRQNFTEQVTSCLNSQTQWLSLSAPNFVTYCEIHVLYILLFLLEFVATFVLALKTQKEETFDMIGKGNLL